MYTDEDTFIQRLERKLNADRPRQINQRLIPELSRDEKRRERELDNAAIAITQRAHAIVVPPTVRLRDGTTGYFSPGRLDACFSCAIATCLQVPLEEVPDIRFDARSRRGESPERISRSAWQIYTQWCATRGIGIVHHKRVPPYPDGRWIGVRMASEAHLPHVWVIVGAELLHNSAAPPAFLKDCSTNFQNVSSAAAMHWGVSFVRNGKQV
jgi:hypothetical protein